MYDLDSIPKSLRKPALWLGEKLLKTIGWVTSTESKPYRLVKSCLVGLGLVIATPIIIPVATVAGVVATQVYGWKTNWKAGLVSIPASIWAGAGILVGGIWLAPAAIITAVTGMYTQAENINPKVQEALQGIQALREFVNQNQDQEESN